MARALPIVHRVCAQTLDTAADPITMTRFRRCLLVILLAGTVPVQAHERTSTRIRHAEPINLTAAALPTEAFLRSAGRPVRVRVEAFGRPFELDVESNADVLRELPPDQRSELPPHVLYKGQLADIPDSWLRLTSVAGRVYGAISDGTEVYAIAPARAISGMLRERVPGGPDATLIYRATDVDSGLGPGFCTAIIPEDPPTAAVQYAALAHELASPANAAALVAGRELAIGLVADVQFGQRFIDPHGVMLSRLNTVDGIFGAQVGVSIVATELRVLDDNGAMKSSDATSLLRQLATVRSSTAELRSRGLTHLMTGRDLDGTTAGIAYVDALCSNGFAASLSEQGLDPWIGALVAAHEIGHNFGALHDGETGSPCASTPRTFLMAPSINGSGAFSQCSLATMAPVVDRASCLRSAGFVDLGFAAPASAITGFVGQPTPVTVEVVSVGTRDATSSTVTLTTDSALQLLGAAVTNGTCSTGSGIVTCELGRLATGERRSITLNVQGNTSGQFALSAAVATPGDSNPANNALVVSLTLNSAADGALTISPAVLSGEEGRLQRASVLLTTSGTQALAGVTVLITVPADVLTLVAATADQGTCVQTADGVTCALGNVPPGTTRRADIDLRGTRAGATAIEASLTAGNDGDASNDRASASVSVAAVASTGSGVQGGGSRSGGGAADRALLIALLALALARCLRRAPTALAAN